MEPIAPTEAPSTLHRRLGAILAEAIENQVPDWVYGILRQFDRVRWALGAVGIHLPDLPAGVTLPKNKAQAAATIAGLLAQFSGEEIASGLRGYYALIGSWLAEYDESQPPREVTPEVESVIEAPAEEINSGDSNRDAAPATIE